VYRFAMHRQQADKLEEREREVALQPARSNATKSRVKREVCSLSLSLYSWHDAAARRARAVVHARETAGWRGSHRFLFFQQDNRTLREKDACMHGGTQWRTDF
jgi:hypothetical protein